MSVEAFVMRYGVIAVLLGAGVEGEAVVLTGGVLANRSLLPLWPCAAAAAIGSFAVDQLWFGIGRWMRCHRVVQRITSKSAFKRAIALMERRPTAFIFGFRFVYGLRTVSPVAIGTSDIAARRFLVVNAIAAGIWGPLFTLLGYGFGEAIERILGNARPYSHLLLLIGGLVAYQRSPATCSRDGFDAKAEQKLHHAFRTCSARPS